MGLKTYSIYQYLSAFPCFTWGALSTSCPQQSRENGRIGTKTTVSADFGTSKDIPFGTNLPESSWYQSVRYAKLVPMMARVGQPVSRRSHKPKDGVQLPGPLPKGEAMATGDVKEKDHRIRLNQIEITQINLALTHMVKEHPDERVTEGGIPWSNFQIHNLRDRLNPRWLGRTRRW